MFQTFSINPNLYNPVALKKIRKVEDDLRNHFNDSNISIWAGEAFLKILLGEYDDLDNISLECFSSKCNRNEKLNNQNKSKKVSNFISQEEFDNGYSGCNENMIYSHDDSLEEVENLMSIDSNIKLFLDTRENLWLYEGYDIWRLWKLVKLQDKQAQKKLRMVMEDNNLQQLFSETIFYKPCEQKLEEIFRC